MYIRFITQFSDEYGVTRRGIFQVMYYLYRGNEASNYDKDHLGKLNQWFCTYLGKPDRFTKAKRKDAVPEGLCWFKDSSICHLRKMYEIKALLEQYDYNVTVIRRKDPGYILYEDRYQVCTLPYRNDRLRVR